MPYLSQVNMAVPLLSAPFSGASIGDNIAIAAVPGKKIEVMRIWFANTGANSITFKDGAATALTGVMDFAALATFYAEGDNAPLFETALGNAFIINLSAAAKVSGKVDYTLSP